MSATGNWCKCGDWLIGTPHHCRLEDSMKQGEPAEDWATQRIEELEAKLQEASETIHLVHVDNRHDREQHDSEATQLATRIADLEREKGELRAVLEDAKRNFEALIREPKLGNLRSGIAAPLRAIDAVLTRTGEKERQTRCPQCASVKIRGDFDPDVGQFYHCEDCEQEFS